MEYSGYHEGDKVKVIEEVNTVDGTLYKGAIVKIDELGPFLYSDVRVVDDVGKIWYLDFISIEKI